MWEDFVGVEDFGMGLFGIELGEMMRREGAVEV